MQTTQTTENTLYTEYTYEWEMVSAVETLILSIIIFIMACAHTYNIYSDFFTSERSVIDYRRMKPKLSKGYKRMGYLTLASVWLFWLLMFMAAVQYNFAVGRCMFVANLFEKIGYFGSKCTLYLVLVLRLHEVYGQSAYGYGTKKLIFVAILLVIISCGIYAIVQAFFIIAPLYVDDTDGSYPYFCQYLMQPDYILIAGGLMLLYDLIASISAMVAFIIPLNKVIKACDAYKETNKTSESAQKRLNKMLYTGYKYKVLVFTAALTTLIWIFFLFIGLTNLSTFFIQIDSLVNPLCLLLMTPYYPSDKFYERLCMACILCCDPKRKSYESHASEKHDTAQQQGIDSTVVKSSELGVSVDTDMALKTKIPNNNDDDVQYNLATVQENAKEITPAPPTENTTNDPDDENL